MHSRNYRTRLKQFDTPSFALTKRVAPRADPQDRCPKNLNKAQPNPGSALGHICSLYQVEKISMYSRCSRRTMTQTCRHFVLHSWMNQSTDSASARKFNSGLCAEHNTISLIVSAYWSTKLWNPHILTTVTKKPRRTHTWQQVITLVLVLLRSTWQQCKEWNKNLSCWQDKYNSGLRGNQLPLPSHVRVDTNHNFFKLAFAGFRQQKSQQLAWCPILFWNFQVWRFLPKSFF